MGCTEVHTCGGDWKLSSCDFDCSRLPCSSTILPPHIKSSFTYLTTVDEPKGNRQNFTLASVCQLPAAHLRQVVGILPAFTSACIEHESGGKQLGNNKLYISNCAMPHACFILFYFIPLHFSFHFFTFACLSA